MKAAANFKIEGEIPISSDLKYKFWAKGIDGYDLPKAELSLAQVTAYPVKSTTEAFDSIKFYAGDKIFKFEWFMQRAKEGSLETKITETKNDIYVIKTDPATPLRQETLYHIACKHLHGNKGTNEQEMVDAIYSEFQTLNVSRRLNSTSMEYWGQKNAIGGNPTDLLKYGNGSCGAWELLLLNCVEVHSIVAIEFGVTPLSNTESLLIQKYATQGSGEKEKNYPFLLLDENPSPILLNVVYDIDGIAGQGNSNPHSRFLDHSLVKFNNIIYDPSYGSKYPSLVEWEKNNIFGYRLINLPHARKIDESVIGIKEVL